VPGVHANGDASGAGGPGFAHLPRLEWNGDDVHGWPHPAARAEPADKLVWLAEMALPGYVLGFSVCRFDAPNALNSDGLARALALSWRRAARAGHRNLPISRTRECRGRGRSCLRFPPSSRVTAAVVPGPRARSDRPAAAAWAPSW